MPTPSHEELDGLWAAARDDAGWRADARRLPPAAQRLLLAIADARYVDGAAEARRSRTVYAALSEAIDPGSPADGVRVHRLFEGPFDGGWPLELMHRAFRRATDRETELRCGTLCAQAHVRAGAYAEGLAVVEAILDRTGGTGLEPEGAALLVLHAALSSTARWVEALPVTSAAVAWTTGRGRPGWRAIATGNRVRTQLSLRAVEEAAATLEAHEASVDALPLEARVAGAAEARGYAASVALFRGDAAGALAALRAAAPPRAARAPRAPADDAFLDVEGEALRRLGRAAEARRLVAAALERAPARSEHLHVLDAAFAAADGDVHPALALVDAWSGPGAPSAGVRQVGLTYLLDAAADGPGGAALGARAGALLGASLAARVDEVAAFRASFPGCAGGGPADAAVLSRATRPDGRRDGGVWAVAREALSLCEGCRSALRLDHGRPVVCGGCGAVATVRHGPLPLRPMLPLDDAGFHVVERCAACATG